MRALSKVSDVVAEKDQALIKSFTGKDKDPDPWDLAPRGRAVTKLVIDEDGNKDIPLPVPLFPLHLSFCSVRVCVCVFCSLPVLAYPHGHTCIALTMVSALHFVIGLVRLASAPHSQMNTCR